MARPMDQLDTLALLGRAAAGLEMNVYRAHDGSWHAHIKGVRQWDLEGLRMRTASVSARGVAEAVERDVARGEDLRAALDSRRDRYSVTEVGGNAWCDVGFCGTEQEARDRACEVIGYVIGKRLARALAPQVIPAQTVPGKSRVAL